MEYKVHKGERCLGPALDLLRGLHNACLQQRQEAWKRQHKSLTRIDQQKDLTALRAADERYRALDCDMTRLTTMRRVDLAYKAFFRRLRTGEKPGYPRYKGRDQFTTICFGRTRGWNLDGPWLSLAGIGRLRVSLYRPLGGGEVRGLRIVRRGGRWWAQFVVDVPPAPLPASEKSVGVDVGCTTFATLSDGTEIAHPHFLRAATEQFGAAQRAVSWKRRGSQRRAKAKAALGRLHCRIACQRKDFLHQVSRRLVNAYGTVCLEDLDIVQMVTEGRRSAGLNRSIMDSAWGTLRYYTTYKAESAGRRVVAVPPRGTTQRCSGCGTLVKKALGDRVHRCPVCGLVLGRDVNAAINIHDLGCRSAGAVRPAEVRRRERRSG